MDSEHKKNLIILFVSVALLLISISLVNGQEFKNVITEFDYSIDLETNRLTSVLTPEDSVSIDHVFSYGLIEQKHIITINSPAKNITIKPKLIMGVIQGDFIISKEVNRTEVYPVYDNVFSEIKKVIGYESYNVTERVYGNTEWNGSGKFFVEYETPINSFGKIDIEVCLDGVCYLFDPWWDSDYAYRKTITMNGALLPVSTSHNPLLIKLNSSNFDFSRIQSDCDDIRFIDSTDTTEYDYDIELCNVAGETANFWVDVGSQSGTFTLRMYYGNSLASSGEDEAGTWSDWAVVYNFQNNYLDSLGANHLTTVNNYAYTTTDCPSGYCITPSGGVLDGARGSAFSNLDYDDVGRFIQSVAYGTSTADREFALCLDDTGQLGLGFDDYFAGGYDTKLATYCTNDVPTSYVNASSYTVPTNTWELYSMQYIRTYIYGLALFHNGTTTGVTSTYVAGTHYLLDDNAGTYFEVHLPNGKLDFIRIDNSYVSTTISAAQDRNNVTWQMLFNNHNLFSIGSEEAVPTIDIIFEEPINNTVYTYTPTLRFKPITNNATIVNCSVNINSNITNLLNIANNTLQNISFYNVADNDSSIWNTVSINCSATTILGYHTGSNNTRFGLNFFDMFFQSPESFNATVLDNTMQLFNLTTTIVNQSEINTSSFAPWIFSWNYTFYTTDFTTITPNESTIIFQRSLLIPELTTVYNATVDVGWAEIIIHTLTGYSYYAISPIRQQIVHRTWIGNCTGTGLLPTINFSLFREKEVNQTVRGDLNLNLTILGTEDDRDYSFALTNNTNFTLCINGPFSYQVYAEGEYFNSSYPLRSHFLINTTLTNSSVLQVYLYSLINSSATLTQINVKDTTGNNVEGVIVQARRQYLGEGVTRGVAMCRSDDEGNCIMPLEWYYPKYDFQVYNATTGELLKSTVLTSIFSTPITITIPLTEAYNYWERVSNIMYNYTTTEAGGLTNFTSNVIDLSGGATSVTLTCTKLSILGSTVLYDTTTQGSSISMTCPLGNITGNEYYMVTRVNYGSGDDIIYTETISGVGIGAYGDEGVFITVLVVAAFALSDLLNPAIAMLSAIVGLVMMNLFGFTYLTLPTIMSYVAIAVLIAYLTKRRSS